jgi:DNA polymerase III alpha subunit
MCVFMLDDASGSIEVVVFPEAFKQHGHLADTGQMVIVKGKFEKDDESARILASEIAPIDMVRERLATSVARLGGVVATVLTASGLEASRMGKRSSYSGKKRPLRLIR